MDGDSGTNFILNYLKAMLRNTCFNYEYVQFFFYLNLGATVWCAPRPQALLAQSLRVPIPVSEGKCQSLFQSPDQTLSFKTTW